MTDQMKGLFVGLAVVGGGALACAPRDQPPGADTTAMAAADSAPESMGMPVAVFEANFSPSSGADSAIAGTLRVIEPVSAGDPYRISVNLSGLPPGEHAWHIHDGSCAESAGVVLAFSSTADMEGHAGPLVVDQMGQAARTVDAPGFDRAWLNAGTHSLHVHRDGGADPGPSLACVTI